MEAMSLLTEAIIYKNWQFLPEYKTINFPLPYLKTFAKKTL